MRNPGFLKPFEHRKAEEGLPQVFGEEIVTYAKAIRDHYLNLNYDHRPFLPPKAVREQYPWVWSEEFRKGQACFKYSVAYYLKVKNVLEIGVGAGISALAFYHGSPELFYYGIDLDTQESFYDLAVARELLCAKLPKFEIIQADTRTLKELPERKGFFDLVHIDGGHDLETAKHDMKLAWESEASWILVDDANDSAVAAGVFAAIHELPHGKTDYAYFEDTWSGNLLFRRTG